VPLLLFPGHSIAIEAFAAVAPKGWEKKNLEPVLHTYRTKGFPGSPIVVASYYW